MISFRGSDSNISPNRTWKRVPFKVSKVLKEALCALFLGSVNIKSAFEVLTGVGMRDCNMLECQSKHSGGKCARSLT